MPPNIFFSVAPARRPTALLTTPVDLDRLDLIDEYKFLVHPRIAGHGPSRTSG
jgi:hypothetical protein